MKESEGLQSSRGFRFKKERNRLCFDWGSNHASKEKSFEALKVEEERQREDWIWWETLTVQSMFIETLIRFILINLLPY